MTRSAPRRAAPYRPHRGPSARRSDARGGGRLSIAAVLVLTVSLVLVMREEAPEIVEPPRADAPMTEAERKPDEAAGVNVVPKTAPDASRSGNLGLKPPSPASPAMGLRSGAEPPAADALLRKERMASALPLPAKRAAAEAFPGRADSRDEHAPSANQPRELSNMRTPGDFAAAEPSAQAKSARKTEAVTGASATPGAAPRAAETVMMSEPKSQTESGAVSADSAARDSARLRSMQSAPVAKPAAPAAAQFAGAISSYANLPPEKWLERIEELRKQGRFDEAKTSLAEFKQRYPSHPLPDSIKEWAQP